MTDDFSMTTPCQNCGNDVIIRQSKEHSEYTPAGTCPKCGTFHWVPSYLSGDLTIVSTKTQVSND